MTAIAWSDVLNATDNDPLLTNFTSGGQTLILAVVNKQLDVRMFDGESGDITKLARCFLAAHVASTSKLGATGAVQSESEGGVSRSYHFPTTQAQYMTTSYGRAYYELIGAQAFGPRLL